MFMPIMRMIVGTLIAGTIALAITAATAADSYRSRLTQDTQQAQFSGKADRLRVTPRGSACSLQAWPNFEPKCQLDNREPAGRARTIRVIALR